ncbi:nuclear transport factor 2 family protein [Subtercola endophyticus]|uniref:nuclear transport factor 2 family protein n=1 Tax=Subtercola endophyticus TaxID=2895559 RepID=UPI001E51355E|nr:nuclear transport factor 2 family protein [Subtercola endophyticus]UFS59932.1 nuclear transport factor 2 family protein [Subtercola endophyticus]
MTQKLSPEEVVLAWNAAYVAHDIDTTLTYMSEDFVRLGDSTQWQPTDKETWGRTMKAFLAAWPDWSWDLTTITSSGNLVVCEFLEHGTWTKPMELAPGVVFEPTGEYFEDHDADFFVIGDDGLIKEIRAYITNNVERVYGLSARIAALGNAQ